MTDLTKLAESLTEEQRQAVLGAYAVLNDGRLRIDREITSLHARGLCTRQGALYGTTAALKAHMENTDAR